MSSLPPSRATSDSQQQQQQQQQAQQSATQNSQSPRGSPPVQGQQRHPSFGSAAQQQVLFQAYLQALRAGQIPMPSFAQTGPQAKSPQQYVNHSRTISDAKKGVTYVGQ